jgi:hypothetical protein
VQAIATVAALALAPWAVCSVPASVHFASSLDIIILDKMLQAVMLSVIMLSILMQGVAVVYCYAKYHHAKFCYADYHGAFDNIKLSTLKRNTSESLKSFFLCCVICLSAIYASNFLLA